MPEPPVPKVMGDQAAKLVETAWANILGPTRLHSPVTQYFLVPKDGTSA
jgi:hypothetical protein